MTNLIVLRGGGDLASGVALRLHRTGFQIVILELEKPLAVRRTVSFSEAAYEGEYTVEGVTARLVSPDQFQVTLEANEIPVLIDPHANILRNQFLTSPRSTYVIDAKGIVRHVTLNDPPIGRSVDEFLRVVAAAQYADVHGEVCPSGWKPGQSGMKADPKGSLDYFSKH